MWTDDDFEVMGWHDATVHALSVEPNQDFGCRLTLDLDYIVEWVQPTSDEYFTFLVCPGTLVFPEVARIHGDVDLAYMGMDLQLDGITKATGEGDYAGWTTWTIDGHEFTLDVVARGFTQYLRQRPVTTRKQRLDLTERGGLSFSEIGFDRSSLED